MKRVSIIELDYHAEVLRNLCIYLNGSDFHVNIFTTEKIWKQVGKLDLHLNNFSVYPKKAYIPTAQFLDQHKDKLNNSDLIFFNTLASNFKYFSSQEYSPPIVLRIHNAHAYFGSRFSYRPRLSLFYLWKDFSFFVRKQILKSEWYYKKKFVEKVDYFMFANELITEYAVKNYHIPPSKVIKEPFPLVHFERNSSSGNSSDEVVVGIIGSVDQRRRDYDLVYDSMKEILPKISHQLKLVLLGSSNGYYGKKTKAKFEALESDRFKLQTFNAFIDEATFINWIDKIDFIIIPLNSSVRYTIYRERYGYTKISGNINDIIKYGKPAILPSHYPTDEALDSLTSKYDKKKNPLSSVLFDWIENKSFQKKNSFDIEKKYNRNIIRRKIENSIDKIIQKEI